MVKNRIIGWLTALGVLAIYVAAFFVSKLEGVPHYFWLLFVYIGFVHIGTISAVVAWRYFVLRKVSFSIAFCFAAVALIVLGWEGVLDLIKFY